MFLVAELSKCMQRSLQQVLEALNFTKSGVFKGTNELFCCLEHIFEAPERGQNSLLCIKIKTRDNYVMSKLTFMNFSQRFASAAEVLAVHED